MHKENTTVSLPPVVQGRVLEHRHFEVLALLMMMVETREDPLTLVLVMGILKEEVYWLEVMKEAVMKWLGVMMREVCWSLVEGW